MAEVVLADQHWGQHGEGLPADVIGDGRKEERPDNPPTRSAGSPNSRRGQVYPRLHSLHLIHLARYLSRSLSAALAFLYGWNAARSGIPQCDGANPFKTDAESS